ncbi:hypothetical protein EHV15_35370 [Paenibacillus oralis]|uniref:GxxExxY protein n=1 Tax=Paenibacillus oralis TaxID=2490856 RepID=A0A3P3T9Z4_9BACL|nr:hypothetical protein [Paenibacillus oralis]RRJ54856.1 hypothetical protein EHV15_35370 [Paenibacillus oralis]
MIETPSNEKLFEYMCILGEKLQLQRFSVAQEKQTQYEVEQFMLHANVAFEREKRLSAQDIPDFYIPSKYGCIVLEVKNRYSKRAIYRQLERYAVHENVKGLILLTGTSMHLPGIINDKPAIVVSLGAGWL